MAPVGTTAAFAGAVTLRTTSVSHEPPPFPPALTCSVCAPLAAVTEALMDAASTMVVVVLPSSEYPMALVWFSPQEGALAVRANGDVTFPPLEGLVTLTASEETTGGDPPVTVMATSVTHEAPPLPQDLTCRVCAPDGAVTLGFMEVLTTMVVFALLSSE